MTLDQALLAWLCERPAGALALAALTYVGIRTAIRKSRTP